MRVSGQVGIARSTRLMRWFPESTRARQCLSERITDAQLSRARGRLYQMDVTHLEFPTGSFDAAVATFLFCVLPNDLQVRALRELGRVVKPSSGARPYASGLVCPFREPVVLTSNLKKVLFDRECRRFRRQLADACRVPR